MLFLKLYRYICGYVRFSAKGEFPERLLNLLAGQYVSVWNVQRKSDFLLANMRVKDYKKMRRLRGKSGIVTQVQAKYGLPFLAKKYNRRAGFGLGLVLFFVTLKVLSSFVWNVQVSGVQALNEQEILKACEQLGVKEGVLRTAIDTQEVPTRLALQIDGIAWAALNIEGVRATIEITEAKAPNDHRTPCNLLATADGEILAIEVTEGVSLVQVGDAVAKGQILVSGVVEYADQSTAFKHAGGKIIAKTQKELQAFIPFAQTVTYPTGKVTQRWVISFFGAKIPLYLGSVQGEYQKQTDTFYWHHNNMYLPIYVHKATFFSQISQNCVVSEQTATQMAKDQLTSREAETLKEVQILKQTEEVLVQQEGVLVVRQYICQENIVTEEKISINTTNP